MRFRTRFRCDYGKSLKIYPRYKRNLNTDDRVVHSRQPVPPSRHHWKSGNAIHGIPGGNLWRTGHCVAEVFISLCMHIFMFATASIQRPTCVLNVVRFLPAISSPVDQETYSGRAGCTAMIFPSGAINRK